MEAEACTHRRYVLRGRVQGVGFRHFVWREAKARGISGWVRNRIDGSVEVLACSSRAELTAFELILAQGPRWGRVDTIEKSDVEGGEGPPTPFKIRPTL